MSNFAYVPNVPGAVTNVFSGASMPAGDHWYAAPDAVVIGYNYDGANFTPSSAQAKKAILDQILAIEVKQARAVREQILGISGALARVQAYDTQIATLRTMLSGA